jgi:hypothetical protein
MIATFLELFYLQKWQGVLMYRLILVLAFFAYTAQASHLDTVCKSASDSPPVFGEGLVSYAAADDRGHYFALDSVEGTRLFESEFKIKSIAIQAQFIWVLTSFELIQLKLDGPVVSKTILENNHSMTVADQLILIVKNNGLIVAFDTISKTETWSSDLNEVKGGQAVGITFDGKNAQVIMTSNREGGFNGIATVNPLKGEVLKTTAYDYRKAGVIHPDTSGRWYKGQLILNNGGWIHLITAAQLAKDKAMKPRWVAHAIGSRADLHYMMLRGEFTFKENTLLGCGIYNERQDDEWVNLIKLFEVPLP